MNGKDILTGLGYIDQKYVEEAGIGEFPKSGLLRLKRPLLIAAVTAMLLMLVGCGVVYARSWFTGFFSQKTDAPLSDGQKAYIAENEQVISESQTMNQWTVELRSAICDGTTAYIIIGIRAPEDVSLDRTIVDNVYQDSFGPGNGGMSRLDCPKGTPEVLTMPKGVAWSRIGYSWEEDGDGLSNTKNYVIQLYPDLERSTTEPFGKDAEYRIHIENIVREYEDKAYLQELMKGKYAGQTDVMFTDEETRRLRKTDVLAEGTWDFTIRFQESAQANAGMELLSEPVTVMGYATRKGAHIIQNIYEPYISYEEVQITSFVLRPLTATITYECDVNVNFTSEDSEHIYAVMKDGSQIELLPYGSQGKDYDTLEAETPIVLAEVDHILLADGTVIPVP